MLRIPATDNPERLGLGKQPVHESITKFSFFEIVHQSITKFSMQHFFVGHCIVLGKWGKDFTEQF